MENNRLAAVSAGFTLLRVNAFLSSCASALGWSKAEMELWMGTKLCSFMRIAPAFVA